MAGLYWIEEFTRRWHAGRWRLSDLPNALGVDLLFRRESPLVLGAAFVLDQCCRCIFINDRISDTPLLWPIVAHEAAHLLNGDSPVQLCHARLTWPSGETLAWLGAAKLAVSTAQVDNIMAGHASPEEIAEANGIPLALVNLRLASDSGSEHPSLITSGDALLAWVGYLHRIAAQL